MQPVTRRKPAPKPTDVACREQGPWRGRGDRGKPAGGGEDVRKEGSSPPTAGTVARAGSLRPWCGARRPPLLSIPAWPLQLFSHFHRGGHFLSPPQGSTVWVFSLSPACLTETWASLVESPPGVGWGLAASEPAVLPNARRICQEPLPGPSPALQTLPCLQR